LALFGFIGASGQKFPRYGEAITRDTVLQHFQGILAVNESLSFYLFLMALGFLLLLLSSIIGSHLQEKKNSRVLSLPGKPVFKKLLSPARESTALIFC
jgi:hypothetical protein